MDDVRIRCCSQAVELFGDVPLRFRPLDFGIAVQMNGHVLHLGVLHRARGSWWSGGGLS